MTFALRSLGVFAVLVPVLALSAACEVKDCETEDGKSALCLESLTRYADAQYNQTLEVDYTAGNDIVIENVYGEIVVKPGVAGKVTATFEPFNYESHKDEAQAYDEIRNNLDVAAVADSNGTVMITASRHDAGNGLGAEITVLIPPEFDGTLKVTNHSDGPVNPGDILIDSVGAATALDVYTGKLGDCRIQAAPSVTSSNVICSGEIELRNVSDNVTAQSTSEFDNKDVIVVIDSISDSASGGTITADAGSVQVVFPTGGNFTIDADVAGAGSIAVSRSPGSCHVDNSLSFADVTCGDGGPVYTLQAGHEEDYDGMVLISFAD